MLAGMIVFLLVGNLAILAASRWMTVAEPTFVPASLEGVHKLRAVDA